MSATDQFPPAHLIPENEASSGPEVAAPSDTPLENGSVDQSQQRQLLLPSSSASADSQELNISESDSVKYTFRFDDLGPLVVNKDGTLSRIHNWAQMTDAERERTVRVLGKRNMLRKEAILKDEGESR